MSTDPALLEELARRRALYAEETARDLAATLRLSMDDDQVA